MLGAMSTGKRAGLLTGVFAIVLATAVTGWWLLRPSYAVLFSDLKEQDAAVISQELDRLKVPYQLAGAGRTLMVPESAVHKTRLALMSKQLPLNGAVGFELFNNAEFGVSDFVQKVNYQRALQGELARTILSIEQVHSARVHLALPEQGLFRKEHQKAKGSVTVIAKPGQKLSTGQVLGIQRLVAASVPEIRAEDVTVLDQHGVTLSRSSDAGVGGAGSEQLDSKVELETLLAGKASKVLDGLFGDGNALVTVDAVLNHQQVRTTTEEVLPAMGMRGAAAPAGVVVREKSATRDATASTDARPVGATSSQEIDYQNGKRVEQVVSPAGAVSRLNVAVVVKNALADADVSRVKELVAASVGLQAARGDVVSVYSMAGRAVASQAVLAPAGMSTAPPDSAPQVAGQADQSAQPSAGLGAGGWPTGVGAAAALLLAVLAMVLLRAGHRTKRVEAGASRPMTAQERDAVLRSVQQWLAQPRGGHDA